MARSSFPMVIFGSFLLAFAGGSIYASGYELHISGWIGGDNDVPDCKRSDCKQFWREQGHDFMAVGRDKDAFVYYTRGAKLGDAESMFHLAWMHDDAYRKSVGAEPQAPAVLPMELRANAQMDKGAFARFVAKYEPDGQMTTDPDGRRIMAYAWYRRAAELRFAPAMINLGAMHQNGLVGTPDLSVAFDWYDRAARIGHPIGERQSSLLARDLARKPFCVKDAPEPSLAFFESPTLERTAVVGADDATATKARALARLLVGARTGTATIKTAERQQLRAFVEETRKSCA